MAERSGSPWIGALALSLVVGAALAQPVVVQDDTGRRVALAQPAQRVVSVLPSLTETVCALQRCDRLVGVDRYSSWPASVRRLPQVGGGLDPSVEAILALRPDVVLMARSARGGQRLDSLGVPVVYLEPQQHADVQRALQVVGALLAVPPAEVQRVWSAMDQALTQTAESLPADRRRQRVYVEVSPAPYAAGEASFVGETLQRLGLRNVVPRERGAFPLLSPEWVVRSQPDVVVLGQAHRAGLAARPGWAAMPAVAKQRVCAFDEATWDTLVRPGPRLAEGAQALARCVAQLPSPR
jgi:iron complex transport system substrate-binding protein